MSAMQPSLNITPDTSDGKFNFYSGQIVKLSATLTGENIPQDEQLIFGGMNSKTGLVPYQYPGDEANQFIIDEERAQTSVAMNVAPDGKSATAHLYVLDYDVTSTPPSLPYIEAWTKDTQVRFPDTPYETLLIDVMVPAPSGWQLSPVHGTEIIPSTAEGNFLFCVFSASAQTASNSQPLKNICVRLYWPTELNEKVIGSKNGLRMFATFESETPIPVRPSQSTDIPDLGSYIDLYTDETGFAEVYICPAPDTQNFGGELEFKIGYVQGAALTFAVTDLSTDAAADLDAPKPDGGEPLDLDATSRNTIGCEIAQYDHASSKDQIFLFANGAYQYYQMLGSPPKVGHFQFSKMGLYSLDYDDRKKNNLQYMVVAASGLGNLSSVYQFQCKGEPGSVQPEPEGGLTVPSIVESLYQGNVVNCATIAHGLTIRVPLSPSTNPSLPAWVQFDSPIEISIYIDGYQVQMQEPNRAVRVSSPMLAITQENLNQGYLTTWFPKYDFMGYASSPGNIAGTLQVQYRVYRTDSSQYVTSQIFSCYIDTVPPGSDERARRLRANLPCI